MMQRTRVITSPPGAVPSVDHYHGHTITDPYRWLEDAQLPETKQYAAQENTTTRSVLDLVPGRDKLRGRIEQLLSIGRVASPRVAGSQYFYERRDGHQN